MQAAVRQHAKYEQQSAAGGMDSAAQEAMRHNAERLKTYRAKAKGEIGSIPNWASNPVGAAPSPKTNYRYNWDPADFSKRWAAAEAASAKKFTGAMRNPKWLAAGALGGALYGGAAMSAAKNNPAFQKEQLEREKSYDTGGPLNRLIHDHPVGAVAGLSGASAVSGMLGASFTPRNPALGGTLGGLAPLMVAGLGNRALAAREQRQIK